jgi:hypothetical protein
MNGRTEAFMRVRGFSPDLIHRRKGWSAFMTAPLLCGSRPGSVARRRPYHSFNCAVRGPIHNLAASLEGGMDDLGFSDILLSAGNEVAAVCDN